MGRYVALREAAQTTLSALIATISKGIVTYDLARQMEGAREVKCSEFSRAIQENIG